MTPKNSLLSSISTPLTWIYLVLVLGGFPFYFQHNYIDLTSAKKNYFQSVSILFLILTIAIGIYTYFYSEKKQRINFSFSITDFCALVFAIVILISCCLSPAGAESFWGNEGRQMGGLFLLLCVGVYFAISRYFQPNNWLVWLLFCSAVILWLIVLCNFLDWDLLGMHHHLRKSQQVKFIGTLGNTNINASYSGVLAALMFALYYLNEKKFPRRCFFGASILGIYACLCTASDSWLLAVGSALLLLLLLSMGDASKMLKWWKTCLTFFCASTVMALTIIFANLTNWQNAFILNFQKQPLLCFLTDPRLLLAELLLLLMIYLIIRSQAIYFLKKYGNKILAGFLVLGILITAITIFPMDDSFGTNRGFIWKRTLANYWKFPLHQKLFGYGPNCFLASLEEHFGAEMRKHFKFPFLDAHNEALQFLTVTGLLGMVSYMGMQLTLLVDCLRGLTQKHCHHFDNQTSILQNNTSLSQYTAFSEEKFLLLGSVGITAYLFQGLVNNPSIFTTPLYFIFLGMIKKGIQAHCWQKR